MASFFGQFKAVMRKNFILKMRNKKQALQVGLVHCTCINYIKCLKRI